jgi:hypothetical protein
MAILGGVLVVGSILVSFGAWDGFYWSPILIVTVLAFSAVMIICIVRFPLSLKKIGFYLCHFGILVIIASSFISWQFTQDTSFSVPVNPYAFYGQIAQDDGSMLDLGFEISVASFRVEKYEADYCLYDWEGNVLVETVAQDRKGNYDIGKYGSVSKDLLQQDGKYVDFYTVADGLILVKLPDADKSYEAVLQIRDGDIHTETIGVNDPHVYKGWKFYLMGYDEEYHQYVNIYAKKDPANIPFAIGIWMVIIGTFLECAHFGTRKGDKI